MSRSAAQKPQRRAKLRDTLPRTETTSEVALLPKPRVGPLDTVGGWRRELSTLYRGMRMGSIPVSDGTRLAYVADIGVKVTRVEEELKLAAEMNRQLAALEHQPQPALEPQT